MYTMRIFLTIFSVLLLSKQLKAQVFTKSQLNLVKSKDPVEENILFHKIVHKDSTEVFQVKYFSTLDTAFTDDAPLDSSFIYLICNNYYKTTLREYYYVDGIYRCYYPNDTLKVEGIVDFPGRIPEEIFSILRGAFIKGDNLSPTKFTLNKLGKRGFWNEYYENGILKTQGTYASACFTKGFHNLDLGECKGGYLNMEDTWCDDIKFGIWKDYNRKGELLHKWIYYYDNGNEYRLDLDKQ